MKSTKPHKIIKKDKYLLIILLVFACFSFAFINYAGLIKQNNNHYMPSVYALEDKSYLENDFYIQETKTYNYRIYFSRLIFQVNKIFNDYNITLQVINSLVILAIVLNIYFLAFHFTKNDRFAFFVAFASIFIRHLHLGGKTLIRIFLSPNMICAVFILLGLNLILRRKQTIGYLSLGAGMFFQPINALLAYIAFLGTNIMVKLSYKKFKEVMFSIVKSLTFFVSSAPVIVILFLTQASTKNPEMNDIISFTMTRLSLAYHTLPFSWPLINYFLFGFFLIVTVLLFLKYVTNKMHRMYGLFYSLITLGFLLIGTVFVEIYPIAIIAKAEMFRSLVLFSTFSYLIILYHIFKRITESESRLESFTYILIPLFFFQKLIAPIGLTILLIDIIKPSLFRKVSHKLTEKKTYLWLLITLVSIFLLTISFVLSSKLLNFLSAIYSLNQDKVIFMISMTLFIMFIYLLMSKILFSVRSKKSAVFTYLFFAFLVFMSFLIMETKDTSMQAMCGDIYGATEYIKEHTPKDSVFLIPPTWRDFRLCAERAVFVGLIPVFTDESIVRWHNRLSDITKQTRLNDTLTYNFPDAAEQIKAFLEKYHSNDEADIERLLQKYDFDYFVMIPSMKEDVLNFNIVYKDSNAIIYKVSAG